MFSISKCLWWVPYSAVTCLLRVSSGKNRLLLMLCFFSRATERQAVSPGLNKTISWLSRRLRSSVELRDDQKLASAGRKCVPRRQRPLTLSGCTYASPGRDLTLMKADCSVKSVRPQLDSEFSQHGKPFSPSLLLVYKCRSCPVVVQWHLGL